MYSSGDGGGQTPGTPEEEYSELFLGPETSMQEQHSQMFHQIYSRDVNTGSAMPLQIEQTPIIHPLIQFNSRNRLNFLPLPSTSRMLSQKEPQSPRPTSTRHHSRSLESGRDNTRWRGFYGSFRTFRPNNTTGEQNIWIPTSVNIQSSLVGGDGCPLVQRATYRTLTTWERDLTQKQVISLLIRMGV